MVIALCLYIVGLQVVFSKFGLVQWGWLSATVAVLLACLFPQHFSRFLFISRHRGALRQSVGCWK